MNKRHRSTEMQKQTHKNTAPVQELHVKEADLVCLILEDHKQLKEVIEVIEDSDRSAEERYAAFQEFTPTLIAHAKPEEKLGTRR